MSISRQGKKSVTPVKECPRCGQRRHWARDCPSPKTREQNDGSRNGPKTANDPRPTPRSSGPQNSDASTMRCINCDEKGHYASKCPQKALYCGQPEGEADQARRRGIINGVFCNDILVDTGTTQTLVHKELVIDDDILDSEVMIRCAHGDTASYPLAAVKVTISGKDIIITAGVSSTLPASALLGWDIPELLEFVADRNVGNSADALAAMRRRQQQEALDRDPPSQEGGASATETKTLPETPWDEPELFRQRMTNSLQPLKTQTLIWCLILMILSIPAGQPRITLTRAQKRANRGCF